MPDPAEITGEEILHGMIRDRIGSTDPKDIKLAADLRRYTDGLAATGRVTGMLGKLIPAGRGPRGDT